MNWKITHSLAGLIVALGLAGQTQAFPSYNGDYDGKTIVSFSSGGDDYKSVVPTIAHTMSDFFSHYFFLQILPKKKAKGDMQLYVSGTNGYYYSEYALTADSVAKPGKPKKKKKKKIEISTTGSAGDKTDGALFGLSGTFNEKPTVVTGKIGPGKKGALDMDLKIKPKKPKQLGYDGDLRVHFVGKLKQ
jgi:hypothetical protein